MEIKICPKGHRYDPTIYPSCPVCVGEGSSAFDFGGAAGFGSTESFGGKTEPVGDMGGMGLGTEALGAAFGATEGFGGSGSFDAGFGGAAASFGNTGSFGGNGSFATAPVGFGGMDEYGATAPVGAPAGMGSNVPAGGVEEYGATTPVGYVPNPAANAYAGASAANAYPGAGAAVVPSMPVAGWLVAIEGAAKGMDFRVNPNWNNIGRSKHNDIMIPGDETISRDSAARIGYDGRRRKFYFAPGPNGKNFIEVNDCVIGNVVELHDRDTVTIGNTKLVFVALCGEGFSWND